MTSAAVEWDIGQCRDVLLGTSTALVVFLAVLIAAGYVVWRIAMTRRARRLRAEVASLRSQHEALAWAVRQLDRSYDEGREGM